MFIAHPTGHEPLLGNKSPYFETLHLFRELMDVLSHAPESERVQPLLADVAAKVGRLNGERICLGILKPTYPMIGAIMLGRHYGIDFGFERRKCDKEKLIYVSSRDVAQTKEEQFNAHEYSYSRLSVHPDLAKVA